MKREHIAPVYSFRIDGFHGKLHFLDCDIPTTFRMQHRTGSRKGNDLFRKM